MKIGQLRELLGVRWSVFLLGPAGCGKTAIWRTLMKAQNNAGEKTLYKPINPKAVTRNELYGFLHPQTREWKEGLVSVTFRDMANNTTNKHQWIVLDGDIDAGMRQLLHFPGQQQCSHVSVWFVPCTAVASGVSSWS